MFKNVMKFILALVLASTTAFGFSPIMGNLKVIKASCGGEEFLWKKHDNVILSGDYLVLGGTYEKDIPVDGEECRFEDRYIRTDAQLNLEKDGRATEESQLVAKKRIITCFNDSKDAGDSPEVKTTEIDSPFLKTKIEMKGRDFVITLEERNLCDGEVNLHLSHNTP